MTTPNEPARDWIHAAMRRAQQERKVFLCIPQGKGRPPLVYVGSERILPPPDDPKQIKPYEDEG